MTAQHAVVGQDAFPASQFAVGVNHHLDQTSDTDFGFPAEHPPNLGGGQTGWPGSPTL